MVTTWLLICNAVEAKIYDISQKTEGDALIKVFDHPEGKMKGIDLQSDGSGHYKSGPAGRGKFSEHFTPHQIEVIQFAEQIAHYLNDELAKKHFEKLVVCAEPHMHGVLKQHLSSHVLNAVKKHIEKDYIPLSANELELVINKIKHESF